MVIRKKLIGNMGDAFHNAWDAVYGTNSSNRRLSINRQRFTDAYNVKLIDSAHHHWLLDQQLMYFDTIEFKTEADLTMFVLKWS